MHLTIDDVTEISPSIWRSELAPSDVAIFGSPLSSTGGRSILLMMESPSYSPSKRQLRFDPRSVRVLNVGASREVVMISSASQLMETQTKAPSTAQSVSAGDLLFLTSLPGSLASLGKSLLGGVREHFHGQLKFSEESKRFVESPDNFWTVKIQPRDVSLRITVRGRPQQLPSPAGLVVSDDRPGYATFKLAATNDVPNAVKVILAAGRRAR